MKKIDSLFIKNISQLLLLASSLLIIISIIYNLAYFQIIAPEYFNLLTVNDHLNAALGWLSFIPLALIPIIFSSYLIKTLKKIEDFFHKTIWNFLKSRRNMRRFLKIGGSKRKACILMYMVEIPLLLLIGLPMYFYSTSNIPYFHNILEVLGFSTEVHNYLRLGIVILCLVIMIAYNSNKLGHSLVRLILLSSLVVMPVMTGNLEAKYVLAVNFKDKKVKKDLYTLKTSSYQYNDIFIMRSIEKGLIFRNTHNGIISFMKWDNIEELSSHSFQIIQ